MKVSYTAAAAMEVDKLSQFYAGIDIRLGHRLLDLLSELQSALALNPRLGIKISGDIRRFLLRSFPYAVYYRIDESDDTVWIVSVIHQSRRSGAWRDRVQEEPAIYQLAA